MEEIKSKASEDKKVSKVWKDKDGKTDPDHAESFKWIPPLPPFFNQFSSKDLI